MLTTLARNLDSAHLHECMIQNRAVLLISTLHGLLPRWYTPSLRTHELHRLRIKQEHVEAAPVHNLLCAVRDVRDSPAPVQEDVLGEVRCNLARVHGLGEGYAAEEDGEAVEVERGCDAVVGEGAGRALTFE